MVEPYLMGPTMNGPAAIQGHEANIDLSPSDIFSNLQFGAMGAMGSSSRSASRSGGGSRRR